jgi:GcrA cell cycle regulator
MSERWKNNPWNETTIATLKRLWVDPVMSCSKIAAALGNGISRNAVIGKGARLGLGPKPSHSPHTTATHKTPRKPRPYKLKPVASFSQWVTTYPEKEPEPFVPRVVEAMPSLGLPIDHWRDDTCKYIAGDDMLACGHPVKEGKPYCPGHCAIAYVQKSERTPAQKANDARMAERAKRAAARRWVAEEAA